MQAQNTYSAVEEKVLPADAAEGVNIVTSFAPSANTFTVPEVGDSH